MEIPLPLRQPCAMWPLCGVYIVCLSYVFSLAGEDEARHPAYSVPRAHIQPHGHSAWVYIQHEHIQ